MKNRNVLRFPQPEVAFVNFQAGLRRALKLSKEELDQRVAESNAARTADRVQRGYAKRGPKKTAFPVPAALSRPV